METTITITTIHKPTFIEDLCKNINQFEHKDTDILIIGDCKTPPIKDYCKRVSKSSGIPIQYLDIEAQENSLSDYPDLLDLFPYNTPDRVILGGMTAYLRGAQRIIAVDDDNFPTDSDFVGFHSITGTTKEIPVITNELGWYNVHSMLKERQNIPFYPRGYPFSKRIKESNLGICKSFTGKSIVNQGLVAEDPDIDAITRLANPINVTGFKEGGVIHFGLLNTWSPFNYQNTSLSRELIPCYFRPKSGLRNADIWTAYLFNKLAEHFGDVITFGQPLVKQIRNIHNNFDDLDVELENNKETDYFVDLLKGINLNGCSFDSYFDALDYLIEQAYIETLWANKEYPMIKSFLKEYQVWVDVVSGII
ncbi:MAG: hypothetical protein PHS34_09085 [Candidatus Omnitrophica bacterium]|nr:hypothetical protein [Candidatus Omnitrophota bacterium]